MRGTMFRRRAFSLSVLFLGCGFGLSVFAEDATQLSQIPEVPENNVCGVNTLAMFLRSWGYDGSREFIDEVTPRNANGTSLLQMQQAAEKCGLQTGVYECGIEDLASSRFRLPAVCLLNANASATSSRFSGHYGLILKVDPDPNGKVVWLEGTLGLRFTRSRKEFVEQWWRGYILAVSDPPIVPRFLIWFTMGHLALWISATLFFPRNVKPQRSVAEKAVEQETLCVSQ